MVAVCMKRTREVTNQSHVGSSIVRGTLVACVLHGFFNFQDHMASKVSVNRKFQDGKRYLTSQKQDFNKAHSRYSDTPSL
jgi:hypothetical protein